MSNINSESKIENARKIINFSTALYDLFEELQNNKTCIPEEYQKILIPKYNLTQKQIPPLNHIITQASKRKKIIIYLENRFNINENNEFIESQKIYNFIYKNKNNKQVKAYSHNIAIEFVAPNTPKTTFGFVDQIDLLTESEITSKPIEEIIQELEKNKRKYCQSISYIRKTDEQLTKYVSKKKNSEDLFLERIFGKKENPSANKIISNVNKHEIRHLIDITLGYNPLCTELIAHIYSENDIPLSKKEYFIQQWIKRDYKNLETKFEEINSRYKILKEHNAPQLILDNTLKTLEREKHHFNIRTENLRNIEKLVKTVNLIDYPILSYALSILTLERPFFAPKDLNPDLKILTEFYNQKN